MFDGLELTELSAMVDGQRTRQVESRVFQSVDNDAGGFVLNRKSETMISIRDGSITKAEDQ